MESGLTTIRICFSFDYNLDILRDNIQIHN